MEDRNFIIFIILSTLIIFLFMMTQPKRKPMQKPQGTQQTTQAAGATVAQQPQPALSGTADRIAAGTAQPPETQPVIKQASAMDRPNVPEKTITVTTSLYTATFTNTGAVPLKWQLAGSDPKAAYINEICDKYRVELKWPPIITNPPCDDSPVDLVNPKLRDLGQSRLPLQASIVLGSTVIPGTARWDITDPNDISVQSGSRDLVFTYPLPDGRLIKKTYSFQSGEYSVGYSITMDQPLPKDKTVNAGLDLHFLFEPGNRLTSMNFHGPLSDDLNKVDKVQIKDILSGQTITRQNVNWAGFTDSYFLIAMIQAGEEKLEWQTKFAGTDQDKKDKKSSKEIMGTLLVTPDEKMLSKGEICKLKIFLGPKHREILEQTKDRLVFAIDYGMLWILVRPLLFLLHYVNLGVRNYGVAIIIVTFALRMGMFPLTRKSQESMKEMAKLQPEMQKIKEKYPDDRMKQQEEMSSLMKKYKINPMGGCLPILLQFPVFIAFYKALVISIELRQAPFFLWIHDLSVRDPLLIWPVLMGGTQVLMQKMTPTTNVDPMQARMMMLMPLVFTFMLMYFPAGLLIYWTFSNIVGIGQQVYVNRKK